MTWLWPYTGSSGSPIVLLVLEAASHGRPAPQSGYFCTWWSLSVVQNIQFLYNFLAVLRKTMKHLIKRAPKVRRLVEAGGSDL